MSDHKEEIAILHKKLNKHTDEFRLFLVEDARREERLITSHEKNRDDIKELTAATKGILEAWTAANAFHKFVKWLSTFVVIIGGFFVWVNSKYFSG